MRPVDIDTSRFPVVDVTFHGQVSDEQFADYLERMTEVATRREKNVVIIDASRAGATPPTQRKMQADWLKKHEATLERHSLGTAFIITSRMIRGILTAILWLSPMPGDHAVVSTYVEAEDWAFERLWEAGIEPPARRRSA
ncbi:MAG TPA: hypothetical protein RMH99_17565 [Sandaracinaceae bacterium LLY-WYZ-13_1]|nr:hypothetical protein [Sandaracinaceae bacterium LLY-WYZ-13_1]